MQVVMSLQRDIYRDIYIAYCIHYSIQLHSVCAHWDASHLLYMEISN